MPKHCVACHYGHWKRPVDTIRTPCVATGDLRSYLRNSQSPSHVGDGRHSVVDSADTNHHAHGLQTLSFLPNLGPISVCKTITVGSKTYQPASHFVKLYLCASNWCFTHGRLLSQSGHSIPLWAPLMPRIFRLWKG